MPRTENNSHIASAERAHAGIDLYGLVTVILGLLTFASILLLIYQSNRAFQRRIEAVEVWADSQVKIVKATTEEDPNLRAQYSEEQDVLRQHAQDLKQLGSNSTYLMRLSAYAAVLFLLGTATAVLSLLVKSRYIAYLGVLLGIIGVVFSTRSLL